ncbi:hypothetical protein GQ44DRAFT_503703 [Phaeosphaeriaceae sp. PMI808]|nr:hypothetical protein GQ44DRAFT_503703 [Phaeosphaeriaceae sp. PMI808]
MLLLTPKPNKKPKRPEILNPRPLDITLSGVVESLLKPYTESPTCLPGVLEETTGRLLVELTSNLPLKSPESGAATPQNPHTTPQRHPEALQSFHVPLGKSENIGTGAGTEEDSRSIDTVSPLVREHFSEDTTPISALTLCAESYPEASPLTSPVLSIYLPAPLEIKKEHEGSFSSSNTSTLPTPGDELQDESLNETNLNVSQIESQTRERIRSEASSLRLEAERGFRPGFNLDSAIAQDCPPAPERSDSPSSDYENGPIQKPSLIRRRQSSLNCRTTYFTGEPRFTIQPAQPHLHDQRDLPTSTSQPKLPDTPPAMYNPTPHQHEYANLHLEPEKVFSLPPSNKSKCPSETDIERNPYRQKLYRIGYCALILLTIFSLSAFCIAVFALLKLNTLQFFAQPIILREGYRVNITVPIVAAATPVTVYPVLNHLKTTTSISASIVTSDLPSPPTHSVARAMTVEIDARAGARGDGSVPVLHRRGVGGFVWPKRGNETASVPGNCTAVQTAVMTVSAVFS